MMVSLAFLLAAAVQLRRAASLISTTPLGELSKVGRPRVSFLLASQNGDDSPILYGDASRRTLIRESMGVSIGVLSQFVANGIETAAADDGNDNNLQSLPKITQRVKFDVRISRPDGSFYTRGDESDLLVKKYSIQIGLFGDACPTHCERFLSYVRKDSPIDDVPFPSYGTSTFKSYDQATGVLMGGSIPSLEEVEFAGSAALKYGGRILSAPLWLEKKPADGATAETPPLPHSVKGLLIHKKLSVEPTFGITTRSSKSTTVSDFDRDYVAFGVIMDGEGMDFLNYCQDLPTYSVERPVQDDGVIQDAAKVVFDAQRDFFRGAAKSMGDTRLSKVYPGKLLRRVEVTRVEVIS